MNELSTITFANIREREAAASNEGSYGFVTGRRRSELDKAKAEIGRNVSTVHGDVASLADLDKLYAQGKALRLRDFVDVCERYLAEFIQGSLRASRFSGLVYANS